VISSTNESCSGRFARPYIAATALVSLALCIIPARVSADVVDLKVMSFNVRTANAADGVNDWDGNRKNLVEQTIRNFGPDLLGIQEDLKRQRDFLEDQFPGYAVVGRGAQGGTSGEYDSIMYRKSRFDEVRRGFFWLSTTPDVPGSESWGTAFPRMVTWLELSDTKNPGFNFVFMNTHWDHVSSTARINSATLMRQKIHDLAEGIPVLVTGDFNADQGGDAYRRMRGLDDFDTVRNLADTYREIHPENSATVGTAPGFDGHGGDGRIDWILRDSDFTTIDANIDHTSFDGFYPSDHSPINATLRPDIVVPEPGTAAVAGVLLLGASLKRGRRRQLPR
jgi:endonuclease/exonuclease/phosphatase family metal-dependent hydrolase